MIEFLQCPVDDDGSFTVPPKVPAAELVYPKELAEIHSFLLRVPFRFERGRLRRCDSVMHVSFNEETGSYGIEFLDPVALQ